MLIKMTKTYSILQKRLHELEALLNKALSLPLEHRPTQTYSQDIQQRFIFLNNLLTAEIASNPKRPHHLPHIARRLTTLQSAFNDWLSSEPAQPDHAETASTCSCTESCVNDDGDEAASNMSDEEEVFFEDETAEGEEEEGKKMMVKREEKEMKRCLLVRRIGVLGGGFLVVAGLMGYVVLLFSGCLHVAQHQSFLTPT